MAQEGKTRAAGVLFPFRSGKAREVRPLTTDERASCVILSLYMVSFCVAAFVFRDSLLLRIAGVTVAAGGIFLFVAAFFNTEAREKSRSMHPLRSYLFSFFYVLATLFVLRYAAGLVSSLGLSIFIIYAGLLAALVVFRKHMVQVLSTMAAILFLFVTFHNLDDILAGRMGFRDVMRQCGQAVFRIGPIQEMANMLTAGPYLTYLSRIDYGNEQLGNFAAKKVAVLNDNDYQKTTALLDFVSNNIHYVSDPGDGLEYARNPIDTLIAGAGDCEDQALLLCSLLEAVGVKTYMAFTDDHVFVLVRFQGNHPPIANPPHVYVDGIPCYALDAADPGAVVGSSSAQPWQIVRVFDARDKSLVHFTLDPPG